MAAAQPVEQQFAVALLKRLRRPVTKPAVRNLIGWMRAEGGHTHNSAKWNFLNTTQNMPGSGDTGSQGNISVFRDFNQGVEATARTLTNGRYGSILRSLNADPNTFARSVNSTPWGTKSNFSSIINSLSVSGNFANVQQSATAPPVSGRDPGAGNSSPASGSSSLPQLSSIDGRALMALLNRTEASVLQGQMPDQGYMQALGGFVQKLRSQAQQSVPNVAAEQSNQAATTVRQVGQQVAQTGAGILQGFIPGSPVPGQRPRSSSHPTSGLAGYPAFDYMTAAGTKVAAPVSGTITRLSGRDPRAGGSPGGPLGYSIYIQGTNGKRYFLTHLDRVGVKVGQKVRAGQQIAVVAAGPSSWSSPHVHMGVSG